MTRERCNDDDRLPVFTWMTPSPSFITLQRSPSSPSALVFLMFEIRLFARILSGQCGRDACPVAALSGCSATRRYYILGVACRRLGWFPEVLPHVRASLCSLLPSSSIRES